MSFRAVYDAHFAFVWRTLRRLGVAEANVKDALQEVFLVVHRRLDDFEGRAKLTTWLFRICAHVARDQRRRAHVRREVFDEAGTLAYVDPAANSAALSDRREALAAFDAALEHLDPDQREVFVLFELEDMTGDEIAGALSIPLGTVYSRLRLARQAFRRAVLQRALVRPSAEHARRSR